MQSKEIYLGKEHSIAIKDFVVPGTGGDSKLQEDKSLKAFASQELDLQHQFAEIMEKHNNYDEPCYAELCRVFEEFCTHWGTILAGRVGEDLREFVRQQEECKK